MKKITKIVIIGVVLILSHNIFAQQDPQFTQYMYNTIAVNPAYAGSRGVLSINAIHRSQWTGVDGAPTTQTFSVNSPVGNKVGLGLSVLRDEIGPSIETYITADFSYTLEINEALKFAFGLKPGLHLLDVDYGKLAKYNPGDPQLLNNVNRTSPNVGIGGYLHSQKWYVGLSVPNMLKTKHYDDIATSTATERLHVYAIGGYVFDLNDKLKFKPAALIKMVQGAPLGLDVSANFLFNEKFTLGAAYRLESAASAMAGFQITKSLMVGYAYDFDTTEFAEYNSGSHEVFLRFEIGNKTGGKEKGKVSPRFF